MIAYHDWACRPRSTYKLHRLTTDQPTPHHDERIDKRRSTTHYQYIDPGSQRRNQALQVKRFRQSTNKLISNQNKVKRRLDPIDSSTGSHQDEGNTGFIDLIDPTSNYLPDQLRLR
jgi:hypothetical protein